MELKKARNWLKDYFKKNNIATDEADKMLCEVLKVDFSKLVFLENISLLDYLKIKYFACKRKHKKPLTKIFHNAYFYGEKFYVNNNVLSPRQETEILVEKVIESIASSDDISVLDLCTGSGVIATVLAQKTSAKVFASDISKKALKVAKLNAKKHNVDANFIHSDMFQNISQKFDIIVSNPPYIETEVCKTLDDEVKKYDPMISLDGGKDGLDFYRIIAEQSAKHLNAQGKVFVEIGYNQRKCVEQLFLSQGFDTICYKDYSNNDRIIVATKIEK